MRNFLILTAALDYIEENLTEPFTLQDLANACHFSLSGLHRLFGFVFSTSLKAYISKRRICRAAKELCNGGITVTDAAIKYQYQSVEVFSRAFKKVWGTTPSEFRRRQSRFTALFPKYGFELMNGGNRMQVDLSDLYDEIKKLRGSYVLCSDIIGFKEINDTYGRPAGDLVLAETAERIGKHATDDMLMFRIGCDEFVLLTGYTDPAQAKEIAESIVSMNGTKMPAGEYKIPLSLRIGITKIPDSEGLSYKTMLDSMMQAIDSARNRRVPYCMAE